MGYGNDELMRMLDASFKDMITTDTLDGYLLNEEQLDRYIRMLQNRTKILPAARLDVMTRDKKEIDRIGFTDRVMRPAASEGTALAESEWAQPVLDKQELSVVEIQGVVSLTDKLLRRNLEKGGFENTILDMFGERGGIDIEELGIKGDTDSSDTYLALLDGWLKKSQKVILEDAAASVTLNPAWTQAAGETTYTLDCGPTGVPIVPGTWILNSDAPAQVAHDDGAGAIVEDGSSGVAGTIDYNTGVVKLTGLTATEVYDYAYTAETFDEDGDTFPEDMYSLFIKVMRKSPYFDRRTDWRMYNPPWVEDAYRDRVRARGTALGDAALTGNAPIPFKQVPIEVIPAMPDNRVWLTHPDNTVYGVFFRVELEREREALKKRTNFILNTEIDFGFENPYISVVAQIS